MTGSAGDGAGARGTDRRRWPYLDWPQPIAFAHRGGAGDWPENSMLAFEGAVALGYRYVETDVHVTADGVLVAFHDDVLDRVTDRRGAIAELAWTTDVSRARIDGREPIVVFEELLAAWPDLRVNVDPKHDRSVAPLAAAIERSRAHDRVCVGAFSDRRLARFRRLTSRRVCTSLGPADIARLRVASAGVPTGRFAAACVQVPERAAGRVLVDRRFVDTAHRRHLPVHVWTIDDPAAMHRLLDLGVDGLMTDRPAVLKEVLQARGQWV